MTNKKNVDNIVKYIEGNPAENKKKLKKERQKQERQEAMLRQEEAKQRLEAIAREQQEAREEEKKKTEAARDAPPMSKKQLKKANQKAKKIAEQNMPPNNMLPPSYSQTGNSGSIDSVNSMEQLKSRHQRELEMMELKHRHALEEEQMSAMYSQKGQPLPKQQYSLPQYQPQTMAPSAGLGSSLGGLGNAFSGLGNAGRTSALGGMGSALGGLGNSGRSPSSPLSSLEDLKAQLNNLTSNTMNQLRSGLMKPSLKDSMDSLTSNQQINSTNTQQSIQPKKTKTKPTTNPVVTSGGDKGKQAGGRSNLPKAAQEALAKVGDNPGNQIRISRNAQGGVDFTAIPANEVKQN